MGWGCMLNGDRKMGKEIGKENFGHEPSQSA